jgi:uncharacterized cupin superfamily protein
LSLKNAGRGAGGQEDEVVDEARMEAGEQGKMATGEGWYALHVSEAPWMTSDRFGSGCRFEGKIPFPELGVNLRILEPGKPACLYHRENAQEDFFVISGECILVVEEQERPLRAGHFVHCPAGTTHVFVGAGSERCVILMIGRRRSKQDICYPVSEVAGRHGASVTEETTDIAKAYAGVQRQPMAPVWPLYGVD